MTALPPATTKRIGTVVGWTLAAILIVCLAGALWIAFRGISAAQHLQAARAQVDNATQAMTDPDAAAVAIRELRADAQAARELTSDPIWWMGSQLPWVGPQLAA